MARPRNKGATRRGYLKRWSSTSVQCPQSVNTYRVKESEVFNIRARANGNISGGKHTLYHTVPITKGKSPQRIAVEERAKELLQGVPEYRHIVLFNGQTYKVKLFFNTDMIFFFLKEDFASVQTSITYRSRERAMEVYKQNKIVWVETRMI